METVILKPFSSLVDGVVDYIVAGDKLKIKYNIKRNAHVGIAKLFLMSSLRPGGRAIVADTLEFADKTATGEKTLDSSALAFWGYRASDIDTFAVAQKSLQKYDILATGFARLIWNTGSEIVASDSLSADYSLINAHELLNSVRDIPRPALRDRLIAKLRELRLQLKKTELSPCKGYDWYELPSSEPPIAVSAYEHILTQRARDSITAADTPLLFGIGEDGSSAFAAKKAGENPFENADDCTIESNGFYVVGVFFAYDGQYFVRPQ